jgi:hypothetical protein
MNEAGAKSFRKSLPGVFRFSVAGFLSALVILFFAAPFLSQLDCGQLIESGLMTVVLVSAVLAVGHRRRVLFFAVFLLVPTVVSRWLHHFWPNFGTTLFFLVSVIVFIVFVIWQLIRYILRAPRVDSEVLCAGISTYLLMGLCWGFAYMLVANTVSNAFIFDGQIETATDMTTFTSVYFSFVTLTTVGFGDIAPNCQIARMLAALEAMAGTMFVAILISRLVSLYTRNPPPKSEDRVDSTDPDSV